MRTKTPNLTKRNGDQKGRVQYISPQTYTVVKSTYMAKHLCSD